MGKGLKKAANLVTPGPMATRCGCSPHHLTRLADRGAIPVVRAGRLRLFDLADETKIRAALARAGFITAGAAKAS